MRRIEWFNKLKIVALAFVTSITLTACSLDVSVPVDLENNKLSSFVSTFSSAVDGIEFTEDGINKLMERLTTIDVNGITLRYAELVRVVDGDTLMVAINGEETKVRLIGVNTPESVASEEYLEKKGTTNSEEGKQASEWVKENIPKELYLQKDVSDTDKYGRSLYYVWMEIPNDCNDIEEIRTKMLNGVLLDKGLAETMTIYPDSKYVNEFEEIEDEYYDSRD